MTNFAEYLYYLAHRIFKRGGADVDKWTKALGPNYDAALEAIFLLREQALVVTAAGAALDALGKERNMPRYPGESDELYRRRLLAAYQIYSSAGTIPGIQEVLRVLGYPQAAVHELFRDGVIIPLHNGQYRYDGAAVHSGGVRWAEFKILMGIIEERDFTAAEADLIIEAINRVKPAHTRLVAVNLGVALADWHHFGDEQSVTLGWKAEDGAAGPILLHTGVAPYGIKHDGRAFYQSGRLRDGRPQMNIGFRVQDYLPGRRTRRPAFRHDGGGPRHMHAGSKLRAGFWHHNGQVRHDGNLRYREGSAHYGDRILIRAGLVNYGAGLPRNGSLTYGANRPSEDMRLVVRRRGRPIEIDAV
ncbi:MAG: phage tail protein [Bacillota bacterium]